eukprot:Gregarina_sp_Poly_1__1228@NODE_12_length_23383_cov_104_521445_g10_i0_p4_GENE_NODE_12_length_23383_cov_104_521445_g10_i0NODE_12_length_23383_cov_104_521445_g10_i0_p4_ORF_typecomplete_len330_score42_56_NODE_12_length_23383_cov_104_521445_g10_i01710818097
MGLVNELLDRKLRRIQGVQQLVDYVMLEDKFIWCNEDSDAPAPVAEEGDSQRATKGIGDIKCHARQIRLYILPNFTQHAMSKFREEFKSNFEAGDVIIGSSFAFVQCAKFLNRKALATPPKDDASPCGSTDDGSSAASTTTSASRLTSSPLVPVETELTPFDCISTRSPYMERLRNSMVSLIIGAAAQRTCEQLLVAVTPDERCICAHKFGKSLVVFETSRTLKGPFTQATLGAMAAGVICGRVEGGSVANSIGFGLELCDSLYADDVPRRIQLLARKLHRRQVFVQETSKVELIEGLVSSEVVGSEPPKPKSKDLLMIKIPYPFCQCM